jgi:alkylation response protein AidB-like acyl-CoA dehydrogenase
MTAITPTERAELLDTARRLARRELAPRAAAMDAGDHTALAECWAQVASLGLDRALLREEHGGADLDTSDLLAIVEELAVGDGGIALSVLLSNAALQAIAPDQLQTIPTDARWVLVPVQPGAEVTICDGRLEGQIVCALGAHGADGLVLAAEQQVPTAVPAGAPGLVLDRDEAQMGLRAAPAASITVAGLTVPTEPTAAAGMGALALLCAGTAAIARGIARRACELALEYAGARHQGGVPIIEHDAVSDMLAAMAVRLALPPPAATDFAHALAAKVAYTDAAVETTTDAVQVFGGTGYMRETGVEKLMRDAKYCQLFPQPNWVARDRLIALQRQRAAA